MWPCFIVEPLGCRMKTALEMACALAFAALPLSVAAGPLPPAGSQYSIKNLVSDQAGVAAVTDPELVNPWGISHVSGGPNWISDNGTDRSTAYNRTTGAKTVSIGIPMGAPTGTVANSGGFN